MPLWGLSFIYKSLVFSSLFLQSIMTSSSITFMAPACSTAHPTSITNAVKVADKFKAVESLQSNPLYSATIWLAALNEVTLLAVCLPVIPLSSISYFVRALGLHTSSLLTPMTLLTRCSSASKSYIVLTNLLFHPTPSLMPTGVSPTFAKELWRVIRLRAFLIPSVSLLLYFSKFV